MNRNDDDELPLENENPEEEKNETEAAVEYDISSYPSDYTLDNLYSQWEKGKIVIPDFQREFVWDIKQSSLLIDSFMKGLPVPPVFLYVDENNKHLVIDGQQRLLSVFFFFDGSFGRSEHGKTKEFRLTGLPDSLRYANKTFSSMAESDRARLENCVLRAINIRQLSPRDDKNTSMYHIFERLNTGGSFLRPQEIRNCVYDGRFVSILKELNSNKEWRKILGTPALNKHQKDVELILRLFSLLENGYQSYEKPIKEYMNRAIGRNRDGDTEIVLEFVERFPKTCGFIVSQLGEKPFHVRRLLNTAYLDSIFYAVYTNLEDIPSGFSQKFAELKCDATFNDNFTKIATQDTAVLKRRFDYVFDKLGISQEHLAHV